MNLIELHMLQSFPVNCLNRDQFGSPKSTLFGGVPRARVSSQCWKRAIRLMAREENEMFSGSRSKYFLDRLSEVLREMGQAEEEAGSIAEKIVTGAKIKIDKGGVVKNLFYFSDLELQQIHNCPYLYEPRQSVPGNFLHHHIQCQASYHCSSLRQWQFLF